MYYMMFVNEYNLTEETYLLQEDCLRYTSGMVDRCEVLNIDYNKSIMGGFVLAPNMYGTYRVLYDVGPEFLKQSKIKKLTNDELADIINKDCKENGYDIIDE